MSNRTEWRNGATDSLPDGPWKTEPDKVQWVDDTTGLDCLIVRGPMGALCGYVGVPPGHPLHGQNYEQPDIDVHGGLSFASACDESADPTLGICHVPLPGRPADVWWFGFDCAHWRDFIPKLSQLDQLVPQMSAYDDVTKAGSCRDIEYVTVECARLAQQLS